MPTTHTPLRYPGGKTRLAPYVTGIFTENSLVDGHYVEPYAGGAGLAVSLLVNGYARYIHLNDIDPSIFAAWHSIVNETEALCKYIHDVNINLEEWHKQKQIQEEKKSIDLLTLGISTLFLNRTNRSGIISGGVIGGKNQNGNYKIGVRFNKKTLIKKIELIAFYKSRIRIYNSDALIFIKNIVPKLPQKLLVNLDPPYYVKGQALYQNFYTHADHKNISNAIPTLQQYWIITYDNVAPIRDLYSKFSIIEYKLSYSAQKKYQGKEILVVDPRLILPKQKLLLAA
jgi:DNA adenine methylase